MKRYYYIITLAVALAGMSAVFPLDVEEQASLGVVKTADKLKKEKFDNILLNSKIDTENKKGNLTRDELVELKSYAIVQKTKLGKFSNKKPVVGELLGAVDTEPTYDIEIVETGLIDGGIEIFARAWKNGVQLGFGKDGTIDIERFRVFNPPILVEDAMGNIVQTWNDEVTGEAKTRTLAENPEEAILQSLTHTISTVGIEGSSIIAGSRGNTTSTFYSGAGDGWTDTYPGYATWATGHDLTSAPAGRVSYTGSGEEGFATVGNPDGTNTYIRRGYLPFDTSSLPDGDDISSATLSLWVVTVLDGDNDGDDWINIVQTTQASNTTLSETDYDQCGAVSNPTEGATRKDLSSGFTSNAYNDFALNATGITWISKTGYTKLGVREGHDATNVALVKTSAVYNSISGYYSEATGTANDPKLVVEHSAGAPATTPTFDHDIYY